MIEILAGEILAGRRDFGRQVTRCRRGFKSTLDELGKDLCRARGAAVARGGHLFVRSRAEAVEGRAKGGEPAWRSVSKPLCRGRKRAVMVQFLFQSSREFILRCSIDSAMRHFALLICVSSHGFHSLLVHKSGRRPSRRALTTKPGAKRQQVLPGKPLAGRGRHQVLRMQRGKGGNGRPPTGPPTGCRAIRRACGGSCRCRRRRSGRRNCRE